MDIAHNADNRSREILPVIEPFTDDDLRTYGISVRPQPASHGSIHHCHLRRITSVCIVKPSPLYERNSQEISKSGGNDKPMTCPVRRPVQRAAAHNDRRHAKRTLERHAVGEGSVLNAWNRIERSNGIVGDIGSELDSSESRIELHSGPNHVMGIKSRIDGV